MGRQVEKNDVCLFSVGYLGWEGKIVLGRKEETELVREHYLELGQEDLGLGRGG